MITNEEIEKAVNWLRDNAQNAAKARAEREYLDAYTKVLKATIMREVEGLESLGAQESRALADPRYQTHLEAWKISVEEDERLRWLRAASECKLEAWRSMQANERALSKI